MATQIIDIEDVISGKVSLPQGKWKSRNPFEIEDLVSVTLLEAGEDLPGQFYVCYRSKYRSEYRMILPQRFRKCAGELASVANQSIKCQLSPTTEEEEDELDLQIAKLWTLTAEMMEQDYNNLKAKYGKL